MLCIVPIIGAQLSASLVVEGVRLVCLPNDQRYQFSRAICIYCEEVH
jgi:hypothetical protein